MAKSIAERRSASGDLRSVSKAVSISAMSTARDARSTTVKAKKVAAINRMVKMIPLVDNSWTSRYQTVVKVVMVI